MIPDADAMLQAMLERLPASEQDSLVLAPGERFVPGEAMENPAWLEEQLRHRGLRWSTNDRRVLATLWWYSASVWVVGPTLSSLVLFNEVLSADPEDLALHWLPDSRITGAHSSRLLSGETPIEAAGRTIRNLYDRVIPDLADLAGMRPRPLWAIAADSIANRLLWLGRSIGDVESATRLLAPLTDAIGQPLPRTRYSLRDDPEAMHTHRCSCCLLYLTPRQQMCSSCPHGGTLRIAERRSRQ